MTSENEQEPPTRHSLAVLVDNQPGVLARVVGLFSGRGYNIESLTVDAVDEESNLSRITIVTTGTSDIVAQLKAQLGRLIPVRHVVNLTEQRHFVESSSAFVKLVTAIAQHDDAKAIGRKFGARIADTTERAIIFELTSERAMIDRMIAQLQVLGPVEIARSGSIAIGCGEAMLALPPGNVERKIA